MKLSIDDKIRELAKSSKRSTELIANFTEGYADGWHMAVKESFRPQLDIKFTNRVDTKPTKEGKPYKNQIRIWTQGSRIAFDKGHIFFDTPFGHEKWDEALKQINLVCVVIDAKPNDVRKKKADNNKAYMNELIEGFVEIELLIPNHEKTGLISRGLFKISQNEFVEFLIRGNLEKIDG